MTKPLKTVDNILAILAWKGKYTDSGQEVVDAGEVERAKAAINNHYKELFLSIIGEDLVNINGSPAKTWMNRYKAELREELAKELGTELSEHFNGEGGE